MEVFNITQKGHPISERTLELNMSCHPPTTSGYGARTVQISHKGQTTHKELALGKERMRLATSSQEQTGWSKPKAGSRGAI